MVKFLIQIKQLEKIANEGNHYWFVLSMRTIHSTLAQKPK